MFRTGFLVLLGLGLLAVIVFGSIKVVNHYERDGRSSYEKRDDEFEQERAEGKTRSPWPLLRSR